MWKPPLTADYLAISNCWNRQKWVNIWSSLWAGNWSSLYAIDIIVRQLNQRCRRNCIDLYVKPFTLESVVSKSHLFIHSIDTAQVKTITQADISQLCA